MLRSLSTSKKHLNDMYSTSYIQTLIHTVRSYIKPDTRDILLHLKDLYQKYQTVLFDIRLPFQIIVKICELIANTSLYEMLYKFSEQTQIAELFESAVNEIHNFFDNPPFKSELMNALKAYPYLILNVSH